MTVPPHALTMRERQGKTILIVDDSQASGRAYHEMLRLEGYRAYSVCEPLRAYDAAMELRPDLIILDYMMDYLTGEDLFKIFRLMPATKSIPIIFMSAHYQTIRELWARCQHDGVVGIVDKGSAVALDNFLAVVAKGLTQSSRGSNEGTGAGRGERAGHGWLGAGG